MCLLIFCQPISGRTRGEDVEIFDAQGIGVKGGKPLAYTGCKAVMGKMSTLTRFCANNNCLLGIAETSRQ
jgi:hypothetical protein